MKILLFGKNGQVGRRLFQKMHILGEVVHIGSDEADFRNPEKLTDIVRSINPNLIINASAYTAVDKAETDREVCFKINTESVKKIVDISNELNSWLIHYSTDYVFDGTKKSAYTEDDDFNPLGVYGESKAQADEYILKNSDRYTILRVSSVYDAHGHNFAKTILNLAKTKEKLGVIHDQAMSPTPAFFIADVTTLVIHMLKITSFSEKYKNIYHLTTKGNVSWYDFTKFLIESTLKNGLSLACSVDDIAPIKTTEYPLPAKRPMNCFLDTLKIEKDFLLYIPDWKVYIPIVIQSLINKGFFEK